MRSVPRPARAAFRRPVHFPLAILAVGFLLAAPARSEAAPERVETPIVSSSTQTDVAASFVRLRVPLPASSLPHPEACEWITYQRYRSTTGPANSMQADAVAVLMPGIMEGATGFDPLARNSVRAAKARGRSIEVWALDRRANCLEDLTGLNRFAETGDYRDATDYYFRGKAIDGRSFGGWKPDDRVLADIGLAQTVQDYNSVLTTELPSQPWRESHVLCGGHSLGGPLTQVFAGWDFDGNRATTTDAGYRQCAGFVGFESMLDLDPAADSPQLRLALQLITGGQLGVIRKITLPAVRSGRVSRHVNIAGADPMSTMILEAVGTAASLYPNQTAAPLLESIPHAEMYDSYLHLVGSANLGQLLTSKVSLRDYRYTNAGLLGQLFDDNGSLFSFTRSSFGYFTGPLRRNTLADDANWIPGLNIAIQKNGLMLPRLQRASGPLTGWTNYDELGSGASQVGAGITTPQTEVTDARDFARLQYEGPTNFTEPYFPTRLLMDLAAFYIGDRGGELKGFTYPHPARLKPRMDALGGSGVAKRAGLGSPDPYVMMPGYEHGDAITAAEKQNNGKPEGSSTMLADMIDRVVPR